METIKARIVTKREQWKQRRNNGFTLVELMLVLLIMGIMIGVVVAFGGGLVETVQQQMTNSAANTYRTQVQIVFQQGLLRTGDNSWRDDSNGFTLNIEGERPSNDDDSMVAAFFNIAANWDPEDTLAATAGSDGVIETFSYYKGSWGTTATMLEDGTIGKPPTTN